MLETALRRLTTQFKFLAKAIVMCTSMVDLVGKCASFDVTGQHQRFHDVEIPLFADFYNRAVDLWMRLLKGVVVPHAEMRMGRRCDVRLCPFCNNAVSIREGDGNGYPKDGSNEDHIFCPVADVATLPPSAEVKAAMAEGAAAVAPERQMVTRHQEEGAAAAAAAEAAAAAGAEPCKCCGEPVGGAGQHDCAHTNVHGKCTKCNKAKLVRQFSGALRVFLRADKPNAEEAAVLQLAQTFQTQKFNTVTSKWRRFKGPDMQELLTAMTVQIQAFLQRGGVLAGEAIQGGAGPGGGAVADDKGEDSDGGSGKEDEEGSGGGGGTEEGKEGEEGEGNGSGSSEEEGDKEDSGDGEEEEGEEDSGDSDEDDSSGSSSGEREAAAIALTVALSPSSAPYSPVYNS